jgi:hypothetical protein
MRSVPTDTWGRDCESQRRERGPSDAVIRESRDKEFNLKKQTEPKRWYCRVPLIMS